MKSEAVCCLGELVHNPEVTEELKQWGLEFIEDIKNANMPVIIRSHGEGKYTYEEAEKNSIKIIDLTCPKVLKTHNIAKEYSNKSYYIFLIGKKTHPETVATISYCGINSVVIERMEDIEIAIEKFNKAELKDLLIMSQTTYSLSKFEEIVEKIKEDINSNINLEIKNTICAATKQRQEETKEIAKQVELMIIIGGKHSSNTNKLYEISKKYCNNAILIENSSEVNIDVVKKYNKIGIMAGASTPKKSIDAVVELLNNI